MVQKGFHVDRQVSLSFFLELFLLASLIVGSWVNLQRQLDGLQRDVKMLLENQGQFVSKVEDMQEKTIALDYRIKAMEGTH
ncbi:MAG: hypothetical protein K9M75_10060 [Phycisphaerae bacterium]|nr:hypothetical protein [Phycisphaerae bacterium]